MRFARSLLIFSYGLFAIAAQTLLFREFITTFEGSDLSVGIFFGSWFLWVGLGAIIVYRIPRLAEKLLRHIELLFVLYVPAFVLQAALIIQARELAGLESYALLSVRTILLLAFLLNAPASLVTGVLFPVACRWFRQTEKLPVSRVYILESAGSFVGGIGVTVLLGLKISSARIFLVLAFILCFSVFVAQLASSIHRGKARFKMVFSLLLVFCVMLCFVFEADRSLSRYVRRVKWTKLLDADSLQGAFHTAQAEYLYGFYKGQWLAMRQGSVVEAVPDESAAGQTAAIALCQNPEARRILVVGSGLGLSRQLLRLPQIEDVTWTHCDSEYVRRVDDYLPAEFRLDDERFGRLAGDIRPLLSEKKQYFDIVFLNLPEATSSVLNRYYTWQFYRDVKEALRPGGVLAVRIAGGENIMGTELVNLGASTKLTLEKVFSRLVLTPGEDTWFIASDSENLTGDPGTLRDRFAAIEGASEILPPDALFSIYLPERAGRALENYSKADLPASLLINTDSRPLTHLYSLLLAAKQSGAPLTRFVKRLALAGPIAFIIPILVFVALRIAYLLKAPGRGGPTGFDSTFLVFSAGFAGIGVVIVLMYLYQTYYGSLYLYIGIISSLFMAGLTIGAALVSLRVAGDRQLRPQLLLLAIAFAHTLIFVVIAFLPARMWTHLCFASAFVLTGLCTGAYFPLAARELADCGFEAVRAGSSLETADHIGASVGGLLASLALVPVLGTRASLFVFALLILANLPPAFMRAYRPAKTLSAPRLSFRQVGYALFGIGLSVVLCSNVLAWAGRRLSGSLPQYAAQSLAGQLQLERVSAHIGDRNISYFKAYRSNQAEANTPPAIQGAEPAGYIFSSEDLAPEVRGFGGRINLAVFIDYAGELVDFHIIRSNETPAYLEMLEKWQERLKKRNLLWPEPFADVDAVTGATVSSEAVLASLRTSARTFAAGVLGWNVQAPRSQELHKAGYLPAPGVVYLLSALVLTLVVIWHGRFWSRLAVLGFNLAAGGIILNAQYSSEQIATILSLHSPALGLSAPFLLAVGIPLVVLFFGNIYCGYICPFGAAQELIGYLVPARFKRRLPRSEMRGARFIKYVILFVLLMALFFSGDKRALSADPLISVFSLSLSMHELQAWLVAIIGIVLVGSIFYTRFWCRYLCPVGAFLSLLNGAALLKRYLPAKKFGRCEFGVTAKDQLDCICCDKCRYDAAPAVEEQLEQRPARAPARLRARCLLIAVVIAAVFVSALSVGRVLHGVPREFDQPAASVAAGGQPRDVDLQRIRTMIRQNKLSDREAEYYKKVENVNNVRAAPQ